MFVKDIEHSKQFYHDLFGLNTILDNDGNVILTEGLVLQDEKIWKEVLNKDIIPENHAVSYISKNRISKHLPESLKSCILMLGMSTG